MAGSGISVGGTTVEQLFNKLTKTTSKKAAATLVGEYLVQVGTHAARAFNYKAAFPKTEPACAPKFVRTSAHIDWKDGQDLVQAEETASEDGFNLRFHRIEADLDALNADTKTLFNCLASLRSSVSDRLDDIKTELNLIDADITRLQDCCDAHGSNPTLDTSTFPHHDYYQEIDPHKKFIGITNYFGKEMLAFKGPEGTILLPKVSGVDGPGDPRVRDVAQLAKAFATDKGLAKLLGRRAVTKEQLMKQAGDYDLGEGTTLGDLLEILPDGAKFDNAAALFDAVAERQAAAIRTGGAVEGLLTSELGFDEVSDVSATGIERYEAIPAPVRAGLITIGVTTMGALAAKSGPELAGALAKEGIVVDAGDAAAWSAAAGVMAMVR